MATVELNYKHENSWELQWNTIENFLFVWQLKNVPNLQMNVVDNPSFRLDNYGPIGLCKNYEHFIWSLETFENGGDDYHKFLQQSYLSKFILSISIFLWIRTLIAHHNSNSKCFFLCDVVSVQESSKVMGKSVGNYTRSISILFPSSLINSTSQFIQTGWMCGFVFKADVASFFIFLAWSQNETKLLFCHNPAQGLVSKKRVKELFHQFRTLSTISNSKVKLNQQAWSRGTQL